MSISALNAGLSGLQAFQQALDVTGNNVANVDTNGFKPQQVQFQSIANGVSVNAVAPGTSSSATAPQSLSASAPSGTDLVAETVNSLQYKYGFDMSAQVVKTADETLGTLVNIQA
jgi:flagellar hook protein FlgE